ncbi:MAG TPA: LPS export ABC transporter permease LptF [Terriglobia bacterium]|nr:LPS export ABC transporter permease LptF [Terriglobia bacterium]
MRILRRYIFFEIVGPFLLGLLVFSFVLITRAAGKPLELLVQKDVSFKEVGLIFGYIMPVIFTFSIPMSVLLAILICFGRLSADSEITAMRSCGVGIKNLLAPVLVFSTLAWVTALINSTFLEPYCNYQFKLLSYSVMLKSISSEMKPRVFEEEFTDQVLYIMDVSSDRNDWRGIFLADISNRDQPKITLAHQGRLINDPVERKLQLELNTGSTHSVESKTPRSYKLVTFNQTEIPIVLSSDLLDETPTKKSSEMNVLELWRQLKAGSNEGVSLSTKDRREREVEVSRRLALPCSIFVFALVGIPLGVISKRGGKSYGFIVSLVIFLIYYLVLFQGINFAKNGRIPAYLGPWLANAVFLALGIGLLLTSEQQTRGSRVLQHGSYRLSNWFWQGLNLGEKTSKLSNFIGNLRRSQQGIRTALPLILDKYVAKGFFLYFALVLGAFVVIFVVFTFFELLNDIVENRIPAIIVINYFRYLLPQIIYYMIPLSVLVGILVNFSVMTRTSQVIAVKATGVSLYRLSASILVLAVFISGFCFALQEYLLPISNQKQDALRAVIKGRSPQTFRRPDRKWMMGEHNQVFNYNLFDEDRNLFGQLTIYELDSKNFEIKRRIYASRATWDTEKQGWFLEDGWVRNFDVVHPMEISFREFKRESFSEFSESPQYFKKEVKASSQMDYRELRGYIQDLERSGFDVVKLSVALHKKLSFPFVSLIMCTIAIPFSFSTGRHGSLYGIGLSIMIGIGYWLTLGFFEQVGGAGKLVPFLAAWAPNLIFGAGGVYLLFNIET